MPADLFIQSHKRQKYVFGINYLRWISFSIEWKCKAILDGDILIVLYFTA